jgi:hypothetical protein
VGATNSMNKIMGTPTATIKNSSIILSSFVLTREC